ncbi:MAG: hypothetical protein JO047_04200 [Alphaproteobacteria bacterium]|nr:hypothetical protein [Alphaproteobacteria bacterium]
MTASSASDRLTIVGVVRRDAACDQCFQSVDHRFDLWAEPAERAQVAQLLDVVPQLHPIGPPHRCGLRRVHEAGRRPAPAPAAAKLHGARSRLCRGIEPAETLQAEAHPRMGDGKIRARRNRGLETARRSFCVRARQLQIAQCHVELRCRVRSGAGSHEILASHLRLAGFFGEQAAEIARRPWPGWAARIAS